MNRTTHHLTEPECDHLRTLFLEALEKAIGTPDFEGIRTALEIYDNHILTTHRTRRTRQVLATGKHLYRKTRAKGCSFAPSFPPVKVPPLFH